MFAVGKKTRRKTIIINVQKMIKDWFKSDMILDLQCLK